MIGGKRPFSSKVVGEDGRIHHRSQLETAVLHNPFLPANMIKSQGRYGLETEEEEWIGEDAVHSHQEDRAGAGGTKRYFAGGIQVATRVDDELIYNLHDPSGMSLVMADVDGNEVGRMLYDGYGGVLTSTVPITLTGTVSNVPDATTGLVYQGGGRWYDPTLGRPLQPNTVGGPPTLPQALNRYAATSFGQPGVYQGAASVPDFWLWAQQQAIKVPIGQAAGKYLFEPRWGDALRWGLKESDFLQISIYAEKRLIPDSLSHLDVIHSQRAGFFRRVRGALEDGLLVTDAYDLENRVGRVHRTVYESLDDVTQLYTQILEGEERAFLHSAKTIGADLFLGIGLDVAFQVGGDLGNPYLTFGQGAGRALAAGVGSAVSTGVGLGVSGGLIWAGVASGPAGWAGLALGLAVDWVWGDQATPWIYENFGLNPNRNLQSLG